MANTSSELPLCTSIQTPCQPCFLGASTLRVSFPYEATAVVTVDIIPHISQLPDGSNSTSFETTTQTDVEYAANRSTYDITLDDGAPLTWTVAGVELTYPTTYALITDFVGAGLPNVPYATARCAEFTDIESLTVPATADPTSFFLPYERGSGIGLDGEATVSAPILDYVGAFQTAWPGFENQQLEECFQFDRDIKVAGTITGGLETVPCVTVSTSISTSCISTRNSSTCITEYFTATSTVEATSADQVTELPQATFSTVSVLSRRTGDAVFTPAQVPVGILPPQTTQPPDSVDAEPVEEGEPVEDGEPDSAEPEQDGTTADNVEDTTPPPANETPAPVPDSPDAATIHSDPIGSYIASGLQPGASDSGPAATGANPESAPSSSQSVGVVQQTGWGVRCVPMGHLWKGLALLAAVAIML